MANPKHTIRYDLHDFLAQRVLGPMEEPWNGGCRDAVLTGPPTVGRIQAGIRRRREAGLSVISARATATRPVAVQAQTLVTRDVACI